jgi:hypothetical protein
MVIFQHPLTFNYKEEERTRLEFKYKTSLKLTRIITRGKQVRLYRRRIWPEALPCFEVPRHEGSSLSNGHQRARAKGPNHLQRKNLP